jgi:hypothetical protein
MKLNELLMMSARDCLAEQFLYVHKDFHLLDCRFVSVCLVLPGGSEQIQ